MPSEKSIKEALLLTENDTTKALGLKVGDHNVQLGQYIPRAEAQSVPSLSFSGLSPDKTYMAVGLDIDAPFPSFGVLGPILHWIQPGLKAEFQDGGFRLKATAPFVANYIGPAPPPGSAPHRYMFMLYEQPEGFEGGKYAPAGGEEMGNWGRIRYDLDSWAEEIGLGGVIAVNYFRSN